jgi:3-dehydroquinate synthase
MRNVVLIGMPGSGKSTVGRRVAGWLGWPLLDTDAIVAQRAGRPVEEIFARDGEAAFRRMEREAVREAAATRPAVIATGGGVVLDSGNMAALRRRGVIVSLGATPEALLARVGADGGGRPLLGSDPAARIAALETERAPRYAQADLMLDASRPVEDLAEELLSALALLAADTVAVALEARSYDVRIGSGILDLLGWEARRRLPAARQAMVLTHPRLRRKFGPRVERVLQAAGFGVSVVTVPEGERSKSLRRASAVIDAMLAAGVERGAVVVALGGGVIGDLAGFVAGTYMRGLALIHLPTTLLAQVDSAIGGKAAVNHPRAKNAIGVIWQPVLVMSDLETLRGAPVALIRAGLAEAVKHGMIADAGYLSFLEERVDALLARDLEALAECVRWSAAIKARVVEQDEQEVGPRRLLNYGHTVGHALEIHAGGALSHGECVAIGMAAEGWIAGRLGLAAAETVGRQNALLARVGLPTALPAGSPTPNALLETMRLDKKTSGGEMRFTLLRAPGEGLIDQTVPEDILREALVACRASS